MAIEGNGISSIELSDVSLADERLVQPGSPSKPGRKGEMRSYESVESSFGRGTSGCYGASFNFINSILGAGIIGLPFAVRECGLVLGMFFFALVIYLTYFSVQVLVHLGISTGKRNYEELVEHCYGNKGFVIISTFMAFFAFGAMCAYLIIIGQTVPPALEALTGLQVSRVLIIFLCSTFIILPLCLLKDMSSLAWTSLISMLADVIIVSAVCIRAQPVAEATVPPIDNTIDLANPSRFFAGVGAISFAFVCQHSTFIVFNTLSEPTEKEWKRVSISSLTFVSIACITLALAGYLAFFGETEANVLENFPIYSEPLINIARICLSLTMVLTFPMENFVARHATMSIIATNFPRFRVSEDVQHYCITLIIWMSALLVGVTVEDLGIVMEFVGAFTGSVIGYIMPALCYFKVKSLRIKKQKIDVVSQGRVCSMTEIGVYIMLAFGVISGAVGTVLALMDS